MMNDHAVIARKVAEMALFAIDLAREEGRKERERLGRELTEAEVGLIADMVERQLKLALAMSR